MTITTDNPTTDTQTVAENVTAAVVQIDPQTLVVEDNIRGTVNLDRKFLASIAQHGVIVPILAHPDTEGNIVVRDGQRRTLAAREAGLATIPAYVVGVEDEKRVRIIQQYITNEHREQLTEADKAAAWRQLSLEGMSVTAISRETGAKREQVKTGLVVAGHDMAHQAVSEHELTLDQALVLIEFEDDADTLAELRKVAKKNPGSFDHYAQRALDDKATREEVAVLTADYESQGFTVVGWPAYDDTNTLFLRDLRTEDGAPLTEENYIGKPGHAVAIGERWGSVSVAHVVVDWKTHGLRKASNSGTVGGRMTEAQKQERRTVVANNKAWASAEKVRRNWLITMLSRKRLPSDAMPYAARTLATASFQVAKAVNDQHKLACELLGTEHQPGKTHPLATMIETTPTKAPWVTVAIALAALEAATDKNTWRNPNPTAQAYLGQLATWGYNLSDVEHVAAGTTPDDDRADATEAEGDTTETADSKPDEADEATEAA